PGWRSLICAGEPCSSITAPSMSPVSRSLFRPWIEEMASSSAATAALALFSAVTAVPMLPLFHWLPLGFVGLYVPLAIAVCASSTDLNGGLGCGVHLVLMSLSALLY